jgi:hypothetical protein
MLSVVAFTLIFVILSFCLCILVRKKRLLSNVEICVGFGFKVLMGCIYGYIFQRYYGGDDTWAMHAASLNETKLLLSDPGQFFWEFGPTTALRNANYTLRFIPLYLSDLEYCLQAKTLGIINLISRGNYYINVLFFNFIVFWGHYWLFVLLTKKYPSKRQLLFIAIFLVPPIIFWLSGIRADGLLFFFTALLIFEVNNWLEIKKASSVILIGLSFFGMLVFRPYHAILMVPAAGAWIIATKFRIRAVKVFAWVYGVSFALILLGFFVSPEKNFFSVVSTQQARFMELHGKTVYALDKLEPNPKSFIKVLPQAFANSLLRPMIWEAEGLLQIVSSLQTTAVLLLIGLCIIRHNNINSWLTNPLTLCFLFYSLSLYIIVGFIVPFPGAIVRYRVIGELMLLCVVAVGLRENTLRKNNM